MMPRAAARRAVVRARGSATPGRAVLPGLAVLPALAVLWSPAAPAVEVYYQPIVRLSAEADTNLDLDAGVHQTVEGYLADLETAIGIDTPTSQTIFRPRVIYRYYPQSSGDDRLEAYLDFNSVKKTERSQFTIAGTIEHQDLFNAEFNAPTFNDVNPNVPTPDTGRVVVGGTRDSAVLLPRFNYSFTPTIGAGLSGTYQDVRYSNASVTDQVNFDYYQARAFTNWLFSQRSELAAGVFAGRFDAADAGSRANSDGVFADLTTSWTPVLSTKFEVLLNHTSISAQQPQPTSAVVNKAGGSAEITYKTQTDQFRLIAKHSISPSGGGAVYDTDQLQFQYDHNFTARFAITGAVGAVRTIGLESQLNNDSRKFAQALVETRYAITQTLFLQGGYQIAYQRYEHSPDSADNNRVYIQIGYQGLGQQR